MKQTNFIPIYLVAGDAFLAEEKIKAISAALKKNSGETALKTFRLSETKIDPILAEARTLPFLVDSQIFVIKDADELKKKDFEILEAYLQKPSSSATLIFQSTEFDKDGKLEAIISKVGEIFVLEEANDKNSASLAFTREKLKKAGKTLSPSAAAKIEQQVGENPAFLSSLLDQLINYSGDAKEITEEMVAAFEENWSETDGFKLTDAICKKQTGEALYLLRKILDEGEQEIIDLLGLLHWQMRRLWQVMILLQEDASEGVVFKKCRISPKQFPFIKNQLRGFSKKNLEKAIEGLFYLDWKLKTGQADGPWILEDWIVKITK